MAKAGRQTTKKRARLPRRELRFALDEVFPKDKADALRRWLAHEKTALAAAREKAKQLDADRREIDHYLAIRDHQTRPPWMDASLPKSSLKKKRRKKHAGGRPREWKYAAIEHLTANSIETHGLATIKALLYEKVADACKVKGIYARRTATQFKVIVDGIRRRYEEQGKSRRKLITNEDHKNPAPIRN